MQRITPAEYSELLESNALADGVDIVTAKWCLAPCETLKSSIRANGTNLRYEVHLTEQNQVWALAGQVNSLPSAVCIKGGKVDDIVGAPSGRQLAQLVEDYC